MLVLHFSVTVCKVLLGMGCVCQFWKRNYLLTLLAWCTSNTSFNNIKSDQI